MVGLALALAGAGALSDTLWSIVGSRVSAHGQLASEVVARARGHPATVCTSALIPVRPGIKAAPDNPMSALPEKPPMKPLIIPCEPAPRVRGFALWALGFRPFYLLASVFAALSVPLWALQFSGHLPFAYVDGPFWHAHEMLFGFALAVIVGFLFTAGRNWSGHATPTGALLAALALLWLAARVLLLTRWQVAAAAANVAFALAAALGLAVPFWRARNQRNYFFVALLLLFAACCAWVHAQRLGWTASDAWGGLQLGLNMLLFIMVVIAGRVLPMFTNNGAPGANASRRAWLEKLSLGLVLALMVADLAGLGGPLPIALALLAAAAHGARWWLWQPWKTLRQPLLWVLHLAYLWIPVHFLLRALAAMGWVPMSAAIHALTVGAAGGLIIGMITRTALGHTGRALRAGRGEIVCYLLIAAAALVRVLLPLLLPALTLQAMMWSSLLWALGFGLYAVLYWPLLSRPRRDGLPG